MAEFASNTIQAHIARYNDRKNIWEQLLLKRSASCPIYPNIWQVVTGKIEPMEKAVDCALREIREETGIEAAEIWTVPYIAMFFDPYKDAVNASPVFGIITNYNTSIKISDEHSEYAWADESVYSRMLKIPSHIEGCKVMERYILSQNNKGYFKYRKK